MRILQCFVERDQSIANAETDELCYNVYSLTAQENKRLTAYGLLAKLNLNAHSMDAFFKKRKRFTLR